VSFCREPFSGYVKKIIDGDSMIVYAKKASIEVRLYGIDCPEYDQPFAKQAKKFVKSKIKKKKILVQPLYYDSYGRLVAVITHGNGVLNAEIVEAGLAWVYPKYCKKRFCKAWKKLERTSKRLNRGIWQDTKPIPPWKWRRNKQ
jgi:endonuclease YncB( thermonuclease family)